MNIRADANNRSRVGGMRYQAFLETVHNELRPQSYLEIGVQYGDTLKLAKCASIAVDPYFVCETKDVVGRKPMCLFYQMTSDDFFAKFDPPALLQRPLDFAFLDGMHLFEFLLRDFINTEKHCTPGSVIAMHDCLPPGFVMTSRDIADAKNPASAFLGWWTGDVWKMVPTLRRYRPDLQLTVLDCEPTGLVLVSGLAPANRVLEGAYDEIIKSFGEMDRSEYDDYWSTVSITPASKVDLGRIFKRFTHAA